MMMEGRFSLWMSRVSSWLIFELIHEHETATWLVAHVFVCQFVCRPWASLRIVSRDTVLTRSNDSQWRSRLNIWTCLSSMHVSCRDTLLVGRGVFGSSLSRYKLWPCLVEVWCFLWRFSTCSLSSASTLSIKDSIPTVSRQIHHIKSQVGSASISSSGFMNWMFLCFSFNRKRFLCLRLYAGVSMDRKDKRQSKEIIGLSD